MRTEYDKAEKDISIAQEINPNARTVRVVRGMLLDKTHPVESNIVIDDRKGRNKVEL